MSASEDLGELRAAVASRTPFGPPSEQPRREIAAGELREAILSRSGEEADPGVLWLRHVRIAGALDLLACDIRALLAFDDCLFEGPVYLRQSRAIDISMVGCEIDGGLYADQIDLRWNFTLRGSKVNQVSLRSALIGGRLSLMDSQIGSDSDGSEALGADDLKVGAGMFCTGKFVANGEVRVTGAEIGGQLVMNGASLIGARGSDGNTCALNADGLEVKGDMVCEEGFRSIGEVRLLGATIHRQMAIGGAVFEGPAEDDAATRVLGADGIRVGGDLFGDGCKATGEVRLLGGEIGGQLSLAGSTLKGRRDKSGEAIALNADGVSTAGGVFLVDGFSAEGQVRFTGAVIGMQFSMVGARLAGVESEQGAARALSADRMRVRGGIFAEGLQASGEVRLLSAHVDAQLSMTGSTIVGTVREGKRIALNAEGIVVRGDVFCDRGFTSTGELRFLDASVGAQFSLFDASLANDGTALSFVGAKADEFILAPRSTAGMVDLRWAKVDSLWDAENGTFAGERPSQLRLDGFSYLSIRDPLDARRRLEWIEPSQKDGFFPGVYAELSNAFRRIGHKSDARKVAIAGERRARAELARWSPRRGLHDLLWLSIGYGYRNWLALVWLLVLLTLGSLVFCLTEDSFVLVQEDGPPFNSILFAIDATVPVLDVGQQRAWSPTGWTAAMSLFLAVSGYALATAVIAAAAGLLSRDQS